ncbi:hypothetical protein GcM3_189022 [Golovinomyces cichoracearum]|uniref:Uncharacterized protein n=1 Tax=Golovinomyces cichoracearum TaxID=62708 RepID=A0A420HII7_9PEZI|nr:hypothetical protein GcM3_189022 [Golovinomyces cichoracearum]
MSRSAFLNMYETIHDETFTASALKNSFKAVGIYPSGPEMVLKSLAEKQQNPDDDQQLIQSFRRD